MGKRWTKDEDAILINYALQEKNRSASGKIRRIKRLARKLPGHPAGGICDRVFELRSLGKLPKLNEEVDIARYEVPMPTEAHGFPVKAMAIDPSIHAPNRVVVERVAPQETNLFQTIIAGSLIIATSIIVGILIVVFVR